MGKIAGWKEAPISLQNKVTWETEMAFTVENKRVNAIAFCNYKIILPESIGTLSTLKELYLQDCGLTNLPESISNLKSLQTLDLTNNDLDTLPESMMDLTSLQTLKISHNKFSTIPESVKLLEQRGVNISK